jgi:hypothetical protein
MTNSIQFQPLSAKEQMDINGGLDYLCLGIHCPHGGGNELPFPWPTTGPTFPEYPDPF